MKPSTDVAVIGAGPNGLSLAAHLADLGADFRIFGRPMETWDTRMPKGMLLKSDGFATSLYAPRGAFTYAAYCAEHGIPYAPLGLPPPLDTFSAYGHAFQERFVPKLEQHLVQSLVRDDDAGSGGGYRLTLSDGSTCRAKSVVVAAGIAHFARLPDALAGLPRALVSHSADHHDLSQFSGRKVAVIGAGSSATDVAGLLHREGAEAHLVCRDTLWFNGRTPDHRSLRSRLRSPDSPIGPGWRSFLYARFPLAFHRLPQQRRLAIVRSHLGPAPGYFAKEMVLGRAYTHLGFEPQGATPKAGGVELVLVNKAGETRAFGVDHVICATGYKPGLTRLPFLDRGLIEAIDRVEDTPILDRQFGSSLPGLYFMGALAANSFGPLVRFACGAAFTAPRLARHLHRAQRL
ncbi:MAG: NAD(P)/FAD-dependent oxidoreductase [Alphaproteobacteria bacterium]|nr:NAD(P)/FAD-dependent oxidoreductase [Alphaproteobacteria bacterium]